jgi:hypothetical protein
MTPGIQPQVFLKELFILIAETVMIPNIQRTTKYTAKLYLK